MFLQREIDKTTKSIEFAPNYDETYYNRGKCCEKNRRKRKSTGGFRES